MSGTDKKSRVAAWINKAEGDWKVVHLLLSQGKEAPTDIICFHAQQCAEKYIKACLLEKGIDFKKIHDIEELAAMLPADVPLPVSRDEQDLLTDYAVDARYPEFDPPPTVEECLAAVKAAEGIRNAIRAGLLP